MSWMDNYLTQIVIEIKRRKHKYGLIQSIKDMDGDFLKSKLIEYIEKDKGMRYSHKEVIYLNPYYEQQLQFLSKEKVRDKTIKVQKFEVDNIKEEYEELINKNDLMEWLDNSSEDNMSKYGYTNDKKLMKKIGRVVKHIIDSEVN